MQALDKNYYELLGLKRDASPEDIRRAYKDLSRIFHPDSNFYDDLINDPVSPKHLEVYNLITSAYKTLSCEESRVRYDQTLLNGTLVGWGEADNAALGKTHSEETVLKKKRPVAKHAPVDSVFGRVKSCVADPGTEFTKLQSAYKPSLFQKMRRRLGF